MTTADDLLTLYWGDRSSSEGEACLDAWLAAGFSLATIEDWWEAGIACVEEAQTLSAAGVRPTQFRLAGGMASPDILDTLAAALAPVSWEPDEDEGPDCETAVIGPYEAICSESRVTLWHLGTQVATHRASSRYQARQWAEAWIRADARQRLPAWERLEYAGQTPPDLLAAAGARLAALGCEGSFTTQTPHVWRLRALSHFALRR